MTSVRISASNCCLVLICFDWHCAFHVSLQIARLCGGVLALFAGKRFLTSVGESVCLKATSYCTLVIALIATEGLLPTVGEHVLFQDFVSCAGITALVTGEGLLSIVH